jgi:TonB family protein
MTPIRERAQRFLIYGVAISIALHIAVLPFVRALPTPAEEQKPTVVHYDPMPTPPPTPPPTPTPKPTLTPHEKPLAPAARHPLRVVAPHVDTHSGGISEPANTHTTGDRTGEPPASATGAPIPNAGTGTPAPPPPEPQPTPTPLSCTRPNVAAATTRAMEPEMPPLALAQGISGTVEVVVSLDAQSRIVGTRVLRSPSTTLNAAALAAARGSQFRTETKNCEPIAADYIFSVEFTLQ